MRDTGYRMQDTGYWIQDAGCRMLVSFPGITNKIDGLKYLIKLCLRWLNI